MGIDTMSGFMFNIFPTLFTIVFILILGIFLFSIFKGINTWRSNNQQPVLSVIAKVVAKRADVSSHGSHQDINGSNHFHSHTYTEYFATFQVESGDRIEFKVKDEEYGLLVEGDEGKLTFQGTRYLSFNRV